MSEYRYCVSLSISHPNKDLSYLTDLIGLKHHRLKIKGQPRTTPNGKPLEGVYKDNVWSAKTHINKRIYSKDKSLEDFLKELNQKLYLYKGSLKELTDSGGYIEYFIGLFTELNISSCLEPSLLKETSDLGIAIGLDIYPCPE